VTAPVSPESSSRLRLTVLLIVVGCLFMALLVRLWFLQVIDVTAARAAVTTNGQVTVLEPAPRGEILDREGQILVGNINIPVIEVEKSDAADTAVVTRLAALAGVTIAATRGAIQNNQYTPLQPVPVVEHASPAQILYVQEHPTLFPGVTATTISEPHVTALGEYAGNLLGYVGPISPGELKTYTKAGYQPTDQVGIGGVEQEFEAELRGTPGKKIVQVNASGQALATVEQVAAVPGSNIRLSINGSLQELAVHALEQGEVAARHTFDPVTHRDFTAPGGSVVAEDPKTGQILALATNPGYDPNLFNDGGISEAAYSRLAPCAAVPAARQAACALDHPGDPLLNRAIQGEYAPGSTFKLATATAGLTYGVITPTSIYDDTGSIDLNGAILHDDDGEGSGPIDLSRAITVSSDNYFNQIGISLWNERGTVGETALQKIADGYGFNRRSGIDLPYEASGVIPTPALYAQEYREDPKDFATGTWYTGDSAHIAIGQGQVLVTPLQLADAYAGFADGGTLHTPQVALDAETGSGHIVKRYRPQVSGRTPTLSADERQALLQGYVGVVNDAGGTAYSDFAGGPLASKDIAGKTGTAQVTGAGKQNTSIFTSFAPADDPRYVVDCFMEDAGYGASVAAPVVRALYDQIFDVPVQPVGYAKAAGNAT
jgi:penicillin-binding protein 2